MICLKSSILNQYESVFGSDSFPFLLLLNCVLNAFVLQVHYIYLPCSLWGSTLKLHPGKWSAEGRLVVVVSTQSVEEYWLSGYQVSVYCMSWVIDICFPPLVIVKERLCRSLKTTVVFHLFIHTPMMSRSGKTGCSEVISQFGQKLWSLAGK